MQCESKICTGRDNKNKRKARKSKQQQQNGTGNKYQFKRMPEEANKPLVKQSADIPPFASACCQQTKPTNRKTKHGRFWRTKFCFVFFPPFYSVLVPTWNDYVVLPTVMNRFITKTSSCKKEKEGTTSVTNYHPDVVPPPPPSFQNSAYKSGSPLLFMKKKHIKVNSFAIFSNIFFSIPSPIYEKIKKTTKDPVFSVSLTNCPS